ncbi:MAG: hypothetical protein IKT58_05590 [Oscillospiraceae bacterium]|nr:hypothetical protein [Oscillospiraceae bacterium]
MLIFTETQTNSLGGISQMLEFLLLIMLLSVAIYGLYTVIRLRKTYLLFPNHFLYPSGCTPETCNDPFAFIDFIVPRLTFMSIACLIMAIGYGLLIFVFPQAQNGLTDILTMLLPAGVLFWYATIQRKVYKNFW